MSSPSAATGDFEHLLADTSDVVLDLASDGRIVSANPAAIEASGYSREEIASLGIARLVAPEFLQIVNHTAKAATASGEAVVFELHLVGKSGNRTWLRAKARLLDAGAGAVVRLVGRNLTEAVEAELRVRQIEERFRAASQASPDSVAINRLSDGKYVEVNDGFTEITGYSREEAIGRTSLELNIWADPQDRATMVRGLIENGIVQNFEARFRKKNGLILSGNMSSRIVMLNGEAHILSVTRDVTAWKLAETTLLERQASLEEAQQLSRTLMAAIEQAAEDIMITDPDGNIQYCNPSFQRITGYSGAEVIGRNPRFLKSGRHDAEFYRQMWATVKAGRIWTGRFTNRRRDGSLVVEDATISPISDPSGKPQGFVAVKRDVTEQLELEAKFQQAQKLESVGRLAGGVAHDFNNLLTVINGYSNLILEQRPADLPLRAEVELILKAGEKAASLTSQLLAFSRKQMIEPRLLDLGAAVLDGERMLRRVLGEDIELRTQAASDAMVLADPGQIHQVLMNLAVNARDAMPNGGTLTIETRNLEIGPDSPHVPLHLSPGPYVLLSVGDSGIGMENEVLDHIFEPFFTTKEPGKGTGLGLSTVYGIVQQNRGGIAVESAPNRGSTFRIYLPRVEARATANQPKTASSDLRGAETVLVVEDQEDVRRMVVTALRGYGYQVLEASDGMAALELAAQHTGAIDIVVTDVVMPVLGGQALAERLKTLRPATMVLFTSGYWDDAMSRRGALPPGTQYLAKPFTPDALAAKVRAVLSLIR